MEIEIRCVEFKPMNTYFEVPVIPVTGGKLQEGEIGQATTSV